MTRLIASAVDPATLDVDVLVVGVHSGDDGPFLAPGAETVSTAWSDLTETLELLGAKGSAGSVSKLPSGGRVAAKLLVAVGLGEPDENGSVDDETLRRAAGVAARAAVGRESLAFALRADAELLATGAILGAYQFDGYKSDDPDRKEPVASITVAGPDAQLERAGSIAAGVTAARDWVNTPANLLRPPDLAADVERRATEAGLGVEVLDEHALTEGGYGGILAVGMGSAAKPRLVRLTWRPEGASKHVALVGKGITFDTGGISIKPANGMWDMKGDMAGAAAVAGTMLAVAALKPAVNVTAYLALAENMPSGDAYRPGDVVTIYGGKTVEVLNTDAEGRMVLADALVRAAEDEPDVLYDTATLTGGQVIALGKRTAGIMGTDEECERVRAAGEKVGEPGWPMPLPEEIKKTMESPIADIKQVSANMERSGHMLQGGIFLAKFVPEDLPWAHIDIAGPGDHSGDAYGYTVSGGTGRPVRTLVELVEEHARRD
ncbi:leucyl aminopeptidase [Stackebrandtia nassauensis]|uniref:Probable cytosol aminopeptidase n=1 Tax=Stackebrandtia nassauensis (strain DSM 44728 / CIP 108903 / NRRL B-16338 / NBRC 102104 / LLR-40K-21) TaxID=446470 RepID=D3Q3W8_STANL|nr:leucyl aminopeptidase [Stackebrandtia nassauensis]ADD44035.1 Leucyl aminopeptidase [Stackebrandtia nassauensis DSM 44728]